MVPASPGCALPALLALLLGLAGFLGISAVQESVVFPEPPAVVVTAILPPTPLTAPTLVPVTLLPPTVVPPIMVPPTVVPITPVVTSTPAALPTGAALTILNVLSPGDMTGEAVEVYNQGETLNLGGWQIVAPDGGAFIFPDFILFTGGLIRVYTRAGMNTPVALYWGHETPAWTAGDTVTLLDASGQVQAVFVVGGGS